MRMLWVACALLFLQSPPFQILTTHLPLPRPGQPYVVQLQVEGGTPPYTWSADRLPPGLRLDPATGEIRGRVQGRFTFLARVADSASPPREITRLLTTSPGPPIDLHWTRATAVAGDRLQGGVTVVNGIGRDADFTVVVVAVNETGKAFTLAYGHQTLPPESQAMALLFDVSEPPGRYTLHADAVAEIAASGEIFRNRLEMPGLVVP